MNSRIKYFIKLYYFFLRSHCFVSDMVKLLTSHYLVKGESYYPELANKRKNSLRIFFDQCVNLLKRGSVNNFYFLYGLDIYGFRKSKDYINTDTFFVRRNLLRDVNGQNIYISVLRDKLLFFCFAKAMNMPVPKVLGHIENSIFVPLYDNEQCDAYRFILSYKICGFAKAIDGECGHGVYSLSVNDDGVLIDGVLASEKVFKSTFAKGKFILQ